MKKKRQLRDELYRPFLEKTIAKPLTKQEKVEKFSPVTVTRKDGSVEIVVSRSNPREPIDLELRLAILKCDQFRCRYCARKPRKPHLDHVLPVIAGGKNEYENLVTACPKCNLKKGADLWTPLTLTQLQLILYSRPKKKKRRFS